MYVRVEALLTNVCLEANRLVEFKTYKALGASSQSGRNLMPRILDAPGLRKAWYVIQSDRDGKMRSVVIGTSLSDDLLDVGGISGSFGKYIQVIILLHKSARENE